MSIDRTSFTPLYIQLAGIMRDMIDTGEWRAGATLPSEQALMEEYELGRAAVREALKILRNEGRITTIRRVGSYVRDIDAERTPVSVEPGVEVIARMPTPEERRTLDIPEGVPVLVVERAGRAPAVLPADRTKLIV
jgi:GntR family transcriptional regulator